MLEDGEIRPIGANETVKVDIRVVSATHQDIPARLADGRFRRDLYARLAGFEMVLPALRDRLEDLPAGPRSWGAESLGDSSDSATM